MSLAFEHVGSKLFDALLYCLPSSPNWLPNTIVVILQSFHFGYRSTRTRMACDRSNVTKKNMLEGSKATRRMSELVRESQLSQSSHNEGLVYIARNGPQKNFRSAKRSHVGLCETSYRADQSAISFSLLRYGLYFDMYALSCDCSSLSEYIRQVN